MQTKEEWIWSVEVRTFGKQSSAHQRWRSDMQGHPRLGLASILAIQLSDTTFYSLWFHVTVILEPKARIAIQYRSWAFLEDNTVPILTGAPSTEARGQMNALGSSQSKDTSPLESLSWYWSSMYSPELVLHLLFPPLPSLLSAAAACCFHPSGLRLWPPRQIFCHLLLSLNVIEVFRWCDWGGMRMRRAGRSVGERARHWKGSGCRLQELLMNARDYHSDSVQVCSCWRLSEWRME